MIRAYYSSLTKAAKGTIIVVLLGVTVSASLAVYSRHKLNQAHEREVIADKLREDGQKALAEAKTLRDKADGLAAQLARADAKLEKLQAAVDKIKVPDKPGPAPEQKQQLIADLQAMGLELVVKPSTTIAPSLVGITERDGKTIWGWGKENLRVPFLEQKIVKQEDLIKGLDKAKTLAESLAEARSKQADASLKAAESFQGEATNIRVALDDTKKALAAEKHKRRLYAIGAAAGGYFIGKQLAK